MNTKDNNNILKEFAKYFKTLCEKNSINKAELSRLSRVSEATLSRVENGTQKPSPETLRKIAPHLKISEKELMIRAGYLPDTDGTEYEPEIRVIQRAAKNMTPQDRKKMLNMIKAAFEEAFSEDDQTEL